MDDSKHSNSVHESSNFGTSCLWNSLPTPRFLQYFMVRFKIRRLWERSEEEEKRGRCLFSPCNPEQITGSSFIARTLLLICHVRLNSIFFMCKGKFYSNLFPICITQQKLMFLLCFLLILENRQWTEGMKPTMLEDIIFFPFLFFSFRLYLLWIIKELFLLNQWPLFRKLKTNPIFFSQCEIM